MGEFETATTGIDKSLGESDYYGKTYAELDIRSFHRSYATQDGLWLLGGEVGRVEPFLEKIELKKDIRSNNLGGQHFVLFIHAVNYPVRVIVSHLNVGIDIPYCTYTDYTANPIDGELHQKVLMKEDTLYTINSQYENKLIGFHPQFITNVIEQSKKDLGLTVYPNPATNVLFIKSSSSNDDNAVIYDCRGSVKERLYIQNNFKKLNISNYQKGIYIIQIGSNVSKFIKQ